MSIENEADVPAGVEDTTAAPAGETSDILSVDSAAERWMAQEDQEDQEDTETAVDTPDTTEPAAAVEEPAPVETPDTPAEDAAIEFDTLPGTARLRLRDGTEVTVGDLKKDWDSFRQVGQIKQQLAAEAQRLQQVTAQSAQKEQFFTQILPVAIAAAQAAMPAPPEPPVFNEDDPIGSMQAIARFESEKVAYQKKQAELMQMQQAHVAQQREAQARQETGLKEYIETQRRELFKTMPHLRDEAKREEFRREYVKLAEEVGFTPEEHSRASDYRLMRLVDLAIDGKKYRALKANPPKATATVPAASTAPIAEPGKRQTAGESANAMKTELFSKARRSGGLSIDDATRLMMQLES